MATVIIFGAETPKNRDGAPFELIMHASTHDRLTLSRVPGVGEHLELGVDDQGHAREYRVVLVRLKAKEFASDGIDAEVYAHRVSTSDAITEAARTNTWRRHGA